MPTPALNVLMASRDLCGLGRDIGTLVTGAAAGALFVTMFQVSTNKWQIDDVLGVWALHGLCGLWGGIACGIFGLEMLGGMGGVRLPGRNRCLRGGRSCVRVSHVA